MLGKVASWLRRRPGRESAVIVQILKKGRDAFARADFAEAMEAASQALELEPECAAALKLRGIILTLRGEHQAAIDCFEVVLQQDPRDFEARVSYGSALLAANRLEDAELAFRHAAALHPEAVDAHNALGSLLLSQKRGAEAKRAFERALELAPGDLRALAGVGAALMSLGQHREAAAWLMPHYQLGKLTKADRYILGQALTHSCSLENGREILEAEYEDAPDSPAIALSLGLNYLLSGHWREGFELYERRHDAQTPNQFGAATPWVGYMKIALADTPEWTGGSCVGKRLLIWGEQGFGDNLMMLRALPVLKREWGAASVTYLCAPPIRPFGACFDDVTFLAPDPAWRAAPGEFDGHCSIMSLLHLMDVTPESIPGKVPYLFAPEESRDRWKDRVKSLPGIRVGLVWAGGTALSLDHLRSLPLVQFAPLLAVGNVSFVSLQKDAAAREELRVSGLPIVDWMGDVGDFMDTVGLMSHLDLIIAVDTALAHLAGAMGRPVWLLNRFGSEWRWMLGREDSVWYPTMRIFYQEEPGNWSAVVGRIAENLSGLVANKHGR